jgi:hypothetical protein
LIDHRILLSVRPGNRGGSFASVFQADAQAQLVMRQQLEAVGAARTSRKGSKHICLLVLFFGIPFAALSPALICVLVVTIV